MKNDIILPPAEYRPGRREKKEKFVYAEGCVNPAEYLSPGPKQTKNKKVVMGYRVRI